MRTGIDRFRESLSEADMERGIKEKVVALGGRVWHVRNSQGQDVVDLTDLIVCLPRIATVALWELKSRKRVVTPGQAGAIAMLAECDRLDTRLIRPWDYDAALAFLDTGVWPDLDNP